MAKTYKVGPATVAIFRIGASAPGIKPGQGPIAKTIYLGTILLGKDNIQMYGQGPGSGQEEEMVGGYSKTLLDAISMTKKQFLSTYDLRPSIGGPVWDFAKAHEHEVRQMWSAYENGDIVETD